MPFDLDIVCSLAILQEDVISHTGRREVKRGESMTIHKLMPKPSYMMNTSSSVNHGRPETWKEDRSNNLGNTPRSDDSKLTVLKAYWRAKGLCFKCEEKWGHTHRCSNIVITPRGRDVGNVIYY